MRELIPPPSLIEITPPPPSLPPPHTPKTIAELRVYADTLLTAPIEDEEVAGYLQRFIKGSMVKAQAGELAEEELRWTQAAEQARRNRSAQRNTVIQKGGVIYAIHARNMIKAKAETEREKAEKALKRAITMQRNSHKRVFRKAATTAKEWTRRRRNIALLRPNLNAVYHV